MDAKRNMDYLLDLGVEARTSLHQAQHLLVGCWNTLDDLAKLDLPAVDRLAVDHMLREVGHYIETEKWVQNPHAARSDDAITHGEAPKVAS